MFVLAVLSFLVAISMVHSRQIVDATVCDILSDPQSFDGKIVRVKGAVSTGFEEFVLKDSSCGQHISAILACISRGHERQSRSCCVCCNFN